LKNREIIGFDRKIELEWINYTAELVSMGSSKADIRKTLAKKLSVYGLGPSKGGALSKTITVLTRIWSNVPKDVIPLREKAIHLFKMASNDEKVILHLGLAISTYPFFFEVMTQIGRLLKLQDTFSSDQITRRIIEKWGDTQRVRRSVSHVLQTLKLWGIIEPVRKVSLYCKSFNNSGYKTNFISYLEYSVQIALQGKIYQDNYLLHPAMFFCNQKVKSNAYC